MTKYFDMGKYNADDSIDIEPIEINFDTDDGSFSVFREVEKQRLELMGVSNVS
jgi:hypothetical protein